ncbi:MAG: hypothetical protein AB2L22_07345 [Syntrophales bacterium]
MATVDRYEVNRRVRTILIRYDVDLTKIDYSFIGNTVYLYGELVKARKHDFNPDVIDMMIRELTRINGVRYIQFDLRNWFITYSGRSLNITKGKTSPAAQEVSTGELEPMDVIIQLDTGDGQERKADEKRGPREDEPPRGGEPPGDPS